jgi:hypothetical protein
MRTEIARKAGIESALPDGQRMQPIERTTLTVNEQQCQKLAERLRAVQVHPDRYLVHPTDEAGRRQWANYWFYVTAICQSTRTFQGVLNGRWIRGWDYLVEASLRRFADFTAERMLSYKADDLRTLLSDDLNPAHSPIDRIDERLEQLHGCARRLLAEYGGEAMNVYLRSGGRLSGAGGLLDLLHKFQAYTDPLQKKSVLLAGMLHEIGVRPLRDPENLKVAMDYHAMRVALRTGMVEVQDEVLADDLRLRRAASAETNQAVRSVVSAACDLVVRASGFSVLQFDKLIWHLGRSCCFYEHDPICGPAHSAQPCAKHNTCTFIQATTYACPNVCVFDGVCRGSRDPTYRGYWETNIYTADY